jgi:hypothetical protein
MNLAELNTRGWTLVDGISSPDDLVELGRTIGCPVPSPNGEIVKEIRRMPANEAVPGSQSSIYGTGPFPLHTDTFFWPLPVRYVILRGHGDIRRPTTVRSITDLLTACDERFDSLAEKSVWLAGTASRRFYCSLKFRHQGSVGWRYDADFMSPANDAAIRVQKILRPLVTSASVDSIEWSGNTAVILSNWKVLHGRGPEPPNEGMRVIERLYVR